MHVNMLYVNMSGMCFYEHALLTTQVKVLPGNVNVSFFFSVQHCAPLRDNRKLIACCSLAGVAVDANTQSRTAVLFARRARAAVVTLILLLIVF